MASLVAPLRGVVPVAPSKGVRGDVGVAGTLPKKKSKYVNIVSLNHIDDRIIINQITDYQPI